MRHIRLFTTILPAFVFLHVTAQNRVGINTNAPAFSLDVRSINHCFGQFKAEGGYAGVILHKSADIYNAYVIYRTNDSDKWTVGTSGNDNYSINNWTVGGDALTVNIANNYVGLGATDPAFRLDVAGRMRLRASNETAGLWLNNNSNTGAIGFIGVANDNHIGLWGNTGVGWSVLMNTDNGYLGVRNGDPKTELHIIHGVSSGANFGLRVQNSGSNNQEWTQYVVNISGNMELYHNGSARGVFDGGSGTYTAVSDARLKKNIQSAEEVLTGIMKLGVKRYQFIKNQADRKYYGLLAQDVEKVFPDVVFHNQGDDGSEYYTMDYSAMGVIAIKGIQELKPVLDKQQAEIAQLQQENKILQQELAELRQLVVGLTGGHTKAQ